MYNSEGNPNIVEYGKETRFGQPGAIDPAEAARMKTRGSVREALRVAIARECIDLDDPRLTANDIRQMFGYKPGTKLSPAQVLAARKISAALNGSLRAMREIEDSIDGKPKETVQNVSMTYEQLLEQSIAGYEQPTE